MYSYYDLYLHKITYTFVVLLFMDIFVNNTLTLQYDIICNNVMFN